MTKCTLSYFYIFLVQVTVDIDDHTTYELAVRKNKAIIPIDDRFLSIVMQDFDARTKGFKVNNPFLFSSAFR